MVTCSIHTWRTRGSHGGAVLGIMPTHSSSFSGAFVYGNAARLGSEVTPTQLRQWTSTQYGNAGIQNAIRLHGTRDIGHSKSTSAKVTCLATSADTTSRVMARLRPRRLKHRERPYIWLSQMQLSCKALRPSTTLGHTVVKGRCVSAGLGRRGPHMLVIAFGPASCAPSHDSQGSADLLVAKYHTATSRHTRRRQAIRSPDAWTKLVAHKPKHSSRRNTPYLRIATITPKRVSLNMLCDPIRELLRPLALFSMLG